MEINVKFDSMKKINWSDRELLSQHLFVNLIQSKNKSDRLFDEIGRPKSKFALSIFRHEIPEKFNVDLNTTETKRKSSIQLADGTTQI